MRKSAIQQLQNSVMLWTVSWAMVGLALGIVQLLRTGEVSWIPGLGLGAAAAGLGMGILYTGLFVMTANWRDSLADTPGVAAHLGPPVLCGLGAGLIAGFLVGGFGGAGFFAALGALTAAAFNWKSAREGLRSRAAARNKAAKTSPAPKAKFIVKP
jgi:hypothetical protein